MGFLGGSGLHPSLILFGIAINFPSFSFLIDFSSYKFELENGRSLQNQIYIVDDWLKVK